ncbi:MAG: glutamate synthase subunit alpha, partial [Cytophagaceae bacterium]|nr:glutamate synthase subunit alpha [Cytophagaceae bacterium]
MKEIESQGLYDPSFEKDSCGIGFVAHLKGKKSHDIVDKALTMLEQMEHRGACGCESTTGDGAGVLIQVPHEFFVNECVKIGIKLPAFGSYGVGLAFWPKDEKLREGCREIFERNIEKLGLKLIGYRKVPTFQGDVGPSALAVEPEMEHVFVGRPDSITNPDEFERKLYVLRNYTTRLVRETYHLQFPDINNLFYFTGLSYKTLVYKGQFTTWQVRQYFPDLQQKTLVSALAVVHSRFSTNTFPSFRLAQPFRYIAHNGEINTLRGNLNWMNAQEASFYSDYFTREELEMIMPI